MLTGFLLAASSQPVLHRYHLIQTLATWPDAQSYCKTKYDDLASVITAKDWAGLGSEASAWGLSQPAWLGLYTDTDNWRWSYNDVSLKVTAYNKWSNYNIMREKCGVIYEDGSWGDYLCNDVNPIICYDGECSRWIRSSLMGPFRSMCTLQNSDWFNLRWHFEILVSYNGQCYLILTETNVPGLRLATFQSGIIYTSGAVLTTVHPTAVA